ncbi:MAG: hypothetical protein HOE50_08800 [Chloroflexi bacterium]|jgi:hypothetical protein|nr:hypothetical protein [Chloroflexota bacterium]MBT4143224.1 hypothetical protein [Chloroflexota bacterium]MBT5252674.1 hypothetical protein [Chloroflexota bacterium]
MLDPRFQEVLAFIEERDEDGAPSVRAKISLKIQAYAQDVDNLRTELGVVEEEVGELQSVDESL